MSPALDYGSVVVLYKVPFNTLQKGNIIAFNDPRGNPVTIVHRIVEVLSNCSTGSPFLVTKGDNNETNPTVDPWNMTRQYYVGKVLFAVPLVGYLSPSLWRSEGLLGYSPLALLIVVSTFFILMIRNPEAAKSANGKKKPSSPSIGGESSSNIDSSYRNEQQGHHE
ncbi:MAG: signal peptidase I [Nitrososphaerota archaeon]|nr:signal peptidase I [Nitrososphaerota archaeon]